MHKKFNHEEIEKKWQKDWKDQGLYNVGERDLTKEKEYVLVEWPYPSGNLHVGHWFAFAVTDIYVRARRMQGKQVLFPMGFDAFGLPAENAAIKNNLDPKAWTESNIEYMKGQLESMGNAFSWDKTTSSTDPEYYKWTQWMFTQFYEKGIAYRGTGTVNWCPGCNTVIANEQVRADGTCDRSGDIIEKRQMPQWMLRITQYADRLIDDLDTLNWPPHIKEAQRQWIGRSSGAEISFLLNFKKNPQDNENRGPNGERAALTVFTTRPDTLYGATYMVLAPEHPWVTLALDSKHDVLENKQEVAEYVKIARDKSEIERTNKNKEKTGVELKGVCAINPATGKEIPLFVADYVLAGYGTGAIMAVPAHDVRDQEFAKKFQLKNLIVVSRHYNFSIKKDVETIDRGDVVDLIIEHPTDGTFLLQREKDAEEPDHVHFVGGGADGEDHSIAIGRELLEETGFSNYEVVAGPIEIHTALGYRHTRDKNQRTKSHFYHIKLKDLKQQKSEIEEGKHTIEWVSKDVVEKLVTWEAHANAWQVFINGSAYAGQGILINSEEFDGMSSEEAKEAITKKVGGKLTNTYRLRDWSIGRQRYWGVPIPIVYDPEGNAHPIPKEHLPWLLPTDVDFRPTGVPPLAKSGELKERVEKIFGKGWTPEVETMDTFVDSSWYFLRYLDNKNDNELSSLEKQNQWMPIDTYFGGSEHTTMHLLYSRFWQKALFDLGLVTLSEPYTMRINRGLVLGPDGNKMSKSKGNVIDPDEQVKRLGADTVKMYLAFMGPYGEASNYPWSIDGIVGQRRFLERVYGLAEHRSEHEEADTTKLLHKTIKKVTTDIGEYKFNTAISALMIFINHAEKSGLSVSSYKTFLQLLAPFAPHLSEELWHECGESTSIHATTWPSADSAFLTDDTVSLSVQINGKMRGLISIPHDADEEVALSAVKSDPLLAQKITSEIIRVVYVKNKIVNLILKGS